MANSTIFVIVESGECNLTAITLMPTLKVPKTVLSGYITRLAATVHPITTNDSGILIKPPIAPAIKIVESTRPTPKITPKIVAIST
jgi:hypothetical protein|tara:strand:+ start:242 stop:499 length:258 start_codon:yes stop_codon:yes gene_type:complete